MIIQMVLVQQVSSAQYSEGSLKKNIFVEIGVKEYFNEIGIKNILYTQVDVNMEIR